MVDVHAANHSWSIKKRHLVNCPRNATNLCTNLNQYFTDDRSDVLSSAKGAGQDNLGDDWKLFKKDSFDLIVELTFTFTTW
jgi:hypothetical protein